MKACFTVDLQLCSRWVYGAVGLEREVHNKVSSFCLLGVSRSSDSDNCIIKVTRLWPDFMVRNHIERDSWQNKARLTWESTSASVNLNNSELCLNLSKNQMESCFHFTSLKMQPASSPVSQTKDKKCHHHCSDHRRSLPSELYWNAHRVWGHFEVI